MSLRWALSHFVGFVMSQLKYLQGLQCLDDDILKQSQQGNSVVEEQAHCNRDEAIPLHYSPLHTDDNMENFQMTSLVADEKSWHNLSKGLMFRKAAIAFIGLCKLNMSGSQYLPALRCIRSALYCYGKYCISHISDFWVLLHANPP